MNSQLDWFSSPVWVDELFTMESREAQAYRVGQRNGHRWCHLWSDDEAALHAMARRIGLKRAWFQDKRSRITGIRFAHYDLTPSRRRLALEYGARERTLQSWLNEQLKALENKGLTGV